MIMMSWSNNAWEAPDTSICSEDVYCAILGPFIDETPASLSR